MPTKKTMELIKKVGELLSPEHAEIERAVLQIKKCKEVTEQIKVKEEEAKAYLLEVGLVKFKNEEEGYSLTIINTQDQEVEDFVKKNDDEGAIAYAKANNLEIPMSIDVVALRDKDWYKEKFVKVIVEKKIKKGQQRFSLK